MPEPKLIERPYREIVDDALIAIVGGVVNEPHIFDIKTAEYALSEPADPQRGIRNVTGTAAGQRRTFQPGIDFVFLPGSDTQPARLSWRMNGGVSPDDKTEFQVDYYRPGSTSPLTDINVGSVTRTLTEAISRELAILYEQINLAYLSGFIDYATGKSLDFVVAILDVIRKTADYAVGEVTFFRDPSVTGAITINAGLRLATADGGMVFETTNLRTMQTGQSSINVPVRATVAGAEGIVAANTITQLLQVVGGIERITNFDPTRQATEDETDEELRKRAKAKLRGLNQCTIPALEQAALEARAEGLEIRDPQFPLGEPDKWTPPGTVQVLIQGDPDRFAAVKGAIEGVRAAGVFVDVLARLVYYKPRLQLKVGAAVTPAGREQIKAELIAAFQAYTDGLGSGQVISGAQLKAQAAGVLGVAEGDLADTVSLRDVLVWLADPEAPGLPGERLPRPDLLVREGQPATDSDIQSWTFEILTEVEGGKALPVLDFTIDDISMTDTLQS